MRRASVLAAWLACGPAAAQSLFEQLPASIPGYDTRFGVPLMTRAENRMRELGIDIGGLDLRPAAEVGVGYDSNVRGTSPPQGSGFTATAASLGMVRDRADTVLAGFLAVDNRYYFSQPSQSRTNWSASTGAAVDVGGGRLSIAVSHLALHEDRADLDSIASDKPIAFTVDHARASYLYRFNRLSLTPNAEFTSYRYSNTTIDGARASQAYRDRQVARAALSGRYELFPEAGIIFALGAANTTYQHPQPGQPSDNSVDGVALVGIDSGSAAPLTDMAADPWRYSVLAGVQTRRFAASSLPARTAPVVDAQVHWQPTGLTGLNLRITRAIEDTAQPNQPSAIVSRARLVLEHEYARDIVFQLAGGVQVVDYGGSAKSGAAFNAGARVNWIVNPNLRAALSYDFTNWREGVQDGAPQVGIRLRNLVLASVRLTP
jgi:hypothetical protein